MSVNILTLCSRRTQRPFQVINMILQEKSHSVCFMFESGIRICQARRYWKVLRRDCVVARFNIEQKFLAQSHSINHHMPYSHDRGYPKKSHLEETVTVTHLLLWRRVTAILEQRIEWRLFPSKPNDHSGTHGILWHIRLFWSAFVLQHLFWDLGELEMSFVLIAFISTVWYF